MVALAPETAASTTESVDDASDARREPLHAARESMSIVGLGEEMKVVFLDGEVEQPETAARSPRELAKDGARDELFAKARRVPNGTHRHEHGRMAIESGPTHVREQAGIFRPRLAPGSGPSSAPRAESERRLLDSSARAHLNRQTR